MLKQHRQYPQILCRYVMETCSKIDMMASVSIFIVFHFFCNGLDSFPEEVNYCIDNVIV